MLSEEVKKYRRLSGDDDPNTPISRIGGYLDGYEKAVEHLPSVMREAMPEERDGVERYIDSIAEPCEDCISREEAIKPFLVDATEEWISADIVRYLKSLLSVMPTIRYPQVPGITPIVIPVEEEQGDIRYDNKTTLNK